MTQPHHHAFNALEYLFHRKLSISPLIPVLIEKGVIDPEDEWLLQELQDEINGIKVLTGYLRSRDYNTFVGFLASVFESSTRSGENVDFGLMKAVKDVVSNFDTRNDTSYADRIGTLIDTYSGKESVAGSAVESVEDKISLKLPFLNDPLDEFTFTSKGGTYHNSEFDITIEALPGICNDDDHVRFTLGVCAYGPFAIPSEYLVATGFACIETSTKLLKPVRVFLQHSLKMVKYDKTHSVIILQSNYAETEQTSDTASSSKYVFEPFWGYEIGGNKQEEKRQIVRPEILHDSPHLWFEIDEFCILCAALKKDKDSMLQQGTVCHEEMEVDQTLQYQGTRNNEHGGRNPVAVRPDAALFGKSPSLEEDTKLERSNSVASSVAATSSSNDHETLPEAVVQFETENKVLSEKRRTFANKRKRSIEATPPLAEKKTKDAIEYAVIFIRPSNMCLTTNKCFLFVSQYCHTSIKECFRQVKKLYGKESWCHDIYQGKFIGQEMNISCIFERNSSHWKCTFTRTPVIKESDIHLKQRSATIDLLEMCSLGMYPPKLQIEVYSSQEYAFRTECKFIIEGIEFSDTLQTYFSVLLPAISTNRVQRTLPLEPFPAPNDSRLVSKVEDTFWKNCSAVHEALRSQPTECLAVCTYLFSEWVVEFKEFSRVLNEKDGFKRADILLTYVSVNNESHLLKLCDALLEILPYLADHVEHMKRQLPSKINVV